jgi:hypothetical protein
MNVKMQFQSNNAPSGITGFLDFFQCHVFQRIENTTFRKLMFPSSDEGGSVFSLPHLRTETDPVSETSCFLFSRIHNNGKSPKPQ